MQQLTSGSALNSKEAPADVVKLDN